MNDYFFNARKFLWVGNAPFLEASSWQAISSGAMYLGKKEKVINFFICKTCKSAEKSAPAVRMVISYPTCCGVYRTELCNAVVQSATIQTQYLQIVHCCLACFARSNHAALSRHRKMYYPQALIRKS